MVSKSSKVRCCLAPSRRRGQGVVGDPVWQDALVRHGLQELTALCCSSPFAHALSKALRVVTFGERLGAAWPPRVAELP